MSIETSPIPVNVLSQNILHDVGRTKNKSILDQSARLESLAATLSRFPDQLDVVGIQEAHKSAEQHNGEVLAEQCGYGPGYWMLHNQKRPDVPSKGRTNEFIGLFGAHVKDATPIELGDNRGALLTTIADVAFVTLHLRAGETARALRNAQSKVLLEALKPYDAAVVFGDFNEPPVKFVAKARHTLKAGGFSSVFGLTSQRPPKTYPTDDYAPVMASGHLWRDAVVGNGMQLDDILVRGERIKVLSAGVLERVVHLDQSIDEEITDTVPRSGSDHEGIWAKLEIYPPQI